jgi:hypothetical protein
LAQDDNALAIPLARCFVRNSAALERLTYDWTAKAVTYRYDKTEGQTAGTKTVDGPPAIVSAPLVSPTPDRDAANQRGGHSAANMPVLARSVIVTNTRVPPI